MCAKRYWASASWLRMAFSQRLASFLRLSRVVWGVIRLVSVTFLPCLPEVRLTQAGEKVRIVVFRSGWEILPCRGQEAPQSALEDSVMGSVLFVKRLGCCRPALSQGYLKSFNRRER